MVTVLYCVHDIFSRGRGWKSGDKRHAAGYSWNNATGRGCMLHRYGKYFYVPALSSFVRALIISIQNLLHNDFREHFV